MFSKNKRLNFGTVITLASSLMILVGVLATQRQTQLNSSANQFPTTPPITPPITPPLDEEYQKCHIADLNNSNFVDLQDYGILATHFLTSGPTGDLNQDYIVDIQDYGLMSKQFLKTCTTSNFIITSPLASPNLR